jgi:pyruvate carboxylase
MSALGNREKIENLSDRRELSAAARALLADKAFSYVYRQLRNQWFNELLDCQHAGVTQDELATRLRTLDVIPVALGNLLENYRVDAQKAARNA